MLSKVSGPDQDRLKDLLIPHHRKILLLAIVSVLGGANEAAVLVIVSRIALTIADGRAETPFFAGYALEAPIALAIAAGLIAFRLFLSAIREILAAELAREASDRLRLELAEGFLHSSWGIQQNEPSGRLLQLSGSFVDQALMTISSFTGVITMFLNLVAMVAVTLVVDVVASLVVMGILVGLALALNPLRHQIRSKSSMNVGHRREFGDAVSELGSLTLEMQIFGVTDQFKTRIRELSKTTSHSMRNAIFFNSMVIHSYIALAFMAIILGLAIASSAGVQEFAAIGAVMLVLLRCLSYGQQLQQSMGAFTASLPYLVELESARRKYEQQVAPTGGVMLAGLGPIQAADLSFSYTKDREALHQVSFEISPGEIVGIIGPSGSGKSTLVQLLLGLREPSKGDITVGGTPVTKIDRRCWTRLAAFVPQEPHLQTGTIEENIRFFRTEISDDQIRFATLQTNLLKDIEALPEGFKTHIGERGVQLSGGQRQRIAISRALVGNPQLLILDEPTSALDTQSEMSIRETLTALKGKITVIIIAHRLSTLDMCDRLMVVESGRLSAFDTPVRLRANNDFYRQALSDSGISDVESN